MGPGSGQEIVRGFSEYPRQRVWEGGARALLHPSFALTSDSPDLTRARTQISVQMRSHLDAQSADTEFAKPRRARTPNSPEAAAASGGAFVCDVCKKGFDSLAGLNRHKGMMKHGLITASKAKAPKVFPQNEITAHD